MQDTSIEAYHGIQPKLGGRQSEVLELLSKVKNATNSEIAKELGRSINTITPRTNELREKNLVEEDERRMCRVTGRNAIAWKIK